MAKKEDTDKQPSGLDDYGIVYLSGEVDADAICKQIIEINMKKSVDCIQLIINSRGGSVSEGFAIIDMMEWSQLPVRTVGLGMLASMALMIFMAGQKGQRVITPRVSILSHRYSWWSIGNHSELIARRKEEDLTHQRIVDHYIRHTKLHDITELQQTLLRDVDTWLTADEAVKYGIADIVEGQALVPMEGEA